MEQPTARRHSPRHRQAQKRAWHQHIGARMRAWRVLTGLPQQTIADLLDIAPSTLGKIERGQQALLAVQALAFAQLLGLSMDAFLEMPTRPQAFVAWLLAWTMEAHASLPLGTLLLLWPQMPREALLRRLEGSGMTN